MKLTCSCGHLIPDQTDSLPNKAHLIPDQLWFSLMETLDEIIGKAAEGILSGDEASHHARTALVHSSRNLYQCPACHSVLINGPRGAISIFSAQANGAGGILNVAKDK